MNRWPVADRSSPAARREPVQVLDQRRQGDVDNNVRHPSSGQ